MNSRFTKISAALMMAAFSLNVSAIAQDTETPDYYVIAQSAQENTITNGSTHSL